MNEQIEQSPLAQFMEYMESKLSPKEYQKFRDKVQTELLDRAPVVAIIGKAGVGKTTTINNLFDVDDFVAEVLSFKQKGHIGDVRRGTTKAIRKRFDLKIGISLDIIDLPGLGDDIRRDKEFEDIYRQILPQCDIVLYVLKADNRTLGEDERILQNIVLPSCDKKKIIIAVNQVDVLGENEGLHWDTRINLPGERQKELIKMKQKDIATIFSEDLNVDPDKIVCYSAIKRYNLLELLHSIVKTTPLGFIFGVLGLMPRNWIDDVEPEWKVKLENVKGLK